MTGEFSQALFHFVGAKFLGYVAEPSLRSLMVGCVAAIALAALRVKRVAVRLYVWTAVLGVALAMPLLGMIVPRLPLGVPASSVENISQHVLLLRNSGQWPAGSVQQAATQRTAVTDHYATASRDKGKERDRWSVLSDQRKAVTSDPSITVRASEWRVASRQQGTGSGERQAMFAAPLKKHFAGAAAMARVTERAQLSSDEMRIRTGPQLQKNVAAPEEMPVMPFKSVPVTADESGMSAAQMASAIALGIYFLIALILLARVLAGVWFSARLACAANDIGEREALRLLRFRACIARLETAPRLRESAALSVPATVGVRRAAILLPLGWPTWTAEQLDAILAHEVSHVARRDALMQLLSLMHRAIFWFSPLAWWLDWQLTELAEQASDEAALAGGADRTRYAETLLGFFAQLEGARGRVWWQGVSMAKQSREGSAERRVDRILSWKGSMSVKKSLAIALVALAAPVIFLAASLHPVLTYAQDKAQDKTQSDKANVIAPGGPKAPALPNAPTAGVNGGVKGGVAAPAIAPAPSATPVPNTPESAPVPAAAPQAGVVAPAMPPAPRVAAPGTGVENPGPMPPAPAGGVISPPLPAAPSGSTTVLPDAPELAPLVPDVPSAAVTSITPMASLAPPAPPSTHTIVGAPADERAAEARLRAAQKALRDAEQQVHANAAQLRAAQEALRKIERRSLEADSEQLHAAEKGPQDAEQVRAQSEQTLAAQQSPLEQMREGLEAARDAQQQAASTANSINAHGGSYFYGYGSRYVIMSGDTNDVTMSGSDEDLQHARELRKKISGDFIWFERDEKSYVITDPAFIAKAKALFAPEDALAKQQDELGREQDALGKQQDALGQQMNKVSVKPPDITADLQRIQARLKELEASGATQSELGGVQSELGQLQSEVGRVQSQAGMEQSAIGRQQADLGRKQAGLGRQQAMLGRQQAAFSREASQQLRSMFDDAIAKGTAKPE